MYDISMQTEIKDYNNNQELGNQAICQLLAEQIDECLPQAENKLWHGHPVWFLDGNPVVGYAVRKVGVTLLFWSGQSFDEPGLSPEGSFKAAEAKYTSVEQINTTDIAGWLKKAESIQWDYKNIVKHKGKLERIK